MKIRLLAVGTKMPRWINEGVNEYQKRLPKHWRFDIFELPAANRARGLSAEQAMSDEAKRLLAQVRDNEKLILLDVASAVCSTEQLADTFSRWQQTGFDYCIAIGGPDGFDPSVKRRADQKISLSPLTLPHPLVRVVIVEQLYRVSCILQNHPYHK